MAEQAMGTPARQTMELTPAEQEAVERMRMSSADRAAEQAARKQARLDAMAPEVRQVIEQRNSRVEAMTHAERRSYLAGQRLAGLARSLRHEVQQGLSLSDAVAGIEPALAADLDWLVGELKKAE
jgi:hypothetical protein